MPGLHRADPHQRAARRSDYGEIRLSRRDSYGLILCAEHYALPYDLLATALGVQPARLRGIVARWRKAGFASTGRVDAGPAWVWLTPSGMAATGLGYSTGRPSLARLGHIRAVLAARLWLEASPVFRQGAPWWHSERRIRAAQPKGPGPGMCPTRRSTGPRCPGSRMAGRSGRWRPS